MMLKRKKKQNLEFSVRVLNAIYIIDMYNTFTQMIELGLKYTAKIRRIELFCSYTDQLAKQKTVNITVRETDTDYLSYPQWVFVKDKKQ